MPKRISPEEESGNAYHVPVMLQEAVDALDIRPDGVYVDCTFGGGGHSREILSKLGNDGRLFAFDQDEDARANLSQDPRLVFIPQNFRHIGRFLRFHKAGKVDGVLADLGVSSHQFDEGDRGFSIRYDAPLDMRMDKRQSLTAAGLLLEMPVEDMHRMFERYGEVTNARTLAQTLARVRALSPIRTVGQLKDAAASIVKGNPNRYFAQVFQALRIAVNDEFGSLEELLEQLPDIVKPGGRVVFITFHSLEDRIVKRFFKEGGLHGHEKDEVYGTKMKERPFDMIYKKPLLPSEEEIMVNPRARSAKLRAAERTGGGELE
jgi:16S rRNA (cytosine1402-N4)-methyltransferase